MKLLHLIRNVIAIAAVAALLSAARSTAAELKPLVVIGISLDRVALQHPVPTYPRTAQILEIAGDVQLLVQVERRDVVGVTLTPGDPSLVVLASQCHSTKGEGEWIFFLFCGMLAGIVTVPAFATLFELLNTESLTHFVQMVLH